MKRFKIGPLLAMLGMLALGAWLVWSRPGADSVGVPLRPGARVHTLRLGQDRGVVEVVPAGEGAHSFRVLWRDGHLSPEMSDAEFIDAFGASRHAHVTAEGSHALFRLLNISSWGGIAWVGVGLVGQVVFAGRTFVQWIISERRGQSVVPAIYWWMALLGGLCLFAYFVWRRDLVGVLGQSSGVVIYARNLRLIRKQARREARRSAG